MQELRVITVFLLISCLDFCSTSSNSEFELFQEQPGITTTPTSHITSFLYQRRKDQTKKNQNQLQNETNFNYNNLESMWKLEEVENQKHQNSETKLTDGLNTVRVDISNETMDTVDDTSYSYMNATTQTNTSDETNETDDEFNGGGAGAPLNNFLVMRLKNKTKAAFGKFILTPIFNVWTNVQSNAQKSLPSGEFPLSRLFRLNSRQNNSNTETAAVSVTESNERRKDKNQERGNLIENLSKERFKGFSGEQMDKSRIFLNEDVGINILEIFGSIIGLAWGAFSHFQNIFTSQGHST